MTERESRNLERVLLWEETWNSNVERMVDELYAEDCEVRNMLTGYVIRGREELRAIERSIQAGAPERKMRIYRRIASGDTVAIEADVEFGGSQTLQACAFLTFNEEGLIVLDHSYGADPTGTTAAKRQP